MYVVNAKRIQDPIPYAIPAVSIKSTICKVLLKYKIWRVVNKSSITSVIITPAIAIDTFLLPMRRLMDASFCILKLTHRLAY
jgi:hypothetical protein